MKFAEITQEVQVARPQVTKFDLGFTPGRRQANKVIIRLLKHFSKNRIKYFVKEFLTGCLLTGN